MNDADKHNKIFDATHGVIITWALQGGSMIAYVGALVATWFHEPIITVAALITYGIFTVNANRARVVAAKAYEELMKLAG